MIAFDVSVNGRRLCTAGVEDGVLSAVMTRVKERTGARRTGGPTSKAYMSVTVSGLQFNSGEHIRWRDKKLKAGDEVTVCIVDAERPDKPLERKPPDEAGNLRAKKAYVRKTARELGWQILTKAKTPKKATTTRKAPASRAPRK